MCRNIDKLALASVVLTLSLCLLVSDARAESVAGPVLDISSVKVKEGDSGKTPFNVQLRLYGPPSRITVNVFATPDTAASNDYEFSPVQVTITSGVPQEVTGYIIGDLVPESDERCRVSATVVSDGGSSYGYGYVHISGGSVTIVDDDYGSGLHVEGASVTEGDEGQKTVEVQVRLEPAAPLTVTVDYGTQGAGPGVDYVSSNGQLTFQPGEVLKIIPLTIIGNTYWESNKKVTVNLFNPQHALLGTPKADVVIANDDQPTRVSLGDLTIDEGHVTRKVPITINFDRPAPPLTKVHVWPVSGTATAGTDFRDGYQTVYPDRGASQVTFNLEILGDTQPECDKGFFVHYEGVYMGDDTERTARVLLRDDDGPVADCPDPFTTSVPVDGGRLGVRDAERPVTPVEDGGRADATISLDSRQNGDLPSDPAPSPDTSPAPGFTPDTGGPIPSDTPDAHVSKTTLSRGSGACAFLPGARSGLGSLVALGLALAWIHKRRRTGR